LKRNQSLIKVFHQNCQCATNKLDLLQLVCTELGPNFVVVSEHGFNEESSKYFNIETYNLGNIFCRKNHKFGGVAIFVKNTITYEKVPLNVCSEKDFEVTAIQFRSENEKIILVGLYRSPTGNINVFFENLEILLQLLIKNNKNTKFILIGDFNINVLNLNNNYVKRFRDILNSFNLHWLINSPTRVVGSSKSAIDNVISNITKTNVSVIDTAISDHYGQLCTCYNDIILNTEQETKLIRCTSPKNIQVLQQMLENETWEEVRLADSVESKFKIFTDKFTFYFNAACPIRSQKFNNIKTQSSWITKGILTSRKNIKLYSKIVTKTNDENFKLYYKRYKTIYRRVIRAAKSYQINKTIEMSKNISKTAWNIINKMKGQQFQKPIIELNLNDKKVNDPFLLAESFNDFFSKVAIHNFSSNSNFYPKNDQCQYTMFLNPVTVTEVISVIKSLPPKRSTDINDLSSWLIKQCYLPVVDIFTELINESFQTGVFPQVYKLAKVIPIYKKGNTLDITNYRPISILPIFSKVLEKLFLIRLNSFLNQYKILSSNQFGFRKGFCTIDAVNKLLEYIITGLDKHQKLLSIFLDLSKAFDCVDHKILLRILQHYGIRGVPLKWLETYLSGRTQLVQIENKCSQATSMNYGVPQGSILGPILFILYVNNVYCPLNSEQFLQYADDTVISFIADTLKALELISCGNVNICIDNFKSVNLKTNYLKSNFMRFSLNHNLDYYNPQIVIDNHIIKEVNSTKFLGIHVDNNLSWNSHVDSICKKVSSGIYLLRMLSFHCNKKILKMAYYGILHSHLAYGISLWGACAGYKFSRIFILQKAAIRIIFKLGYRESCRNAFKELGILTLPSLYIYETAIFCFSKCQMIQGNNFHDYNTRFKNMYRSASHRLQLYEQLPLQSGIKIINRLPDNIKNVQNLNLFKIYLKSFLLSHAYYSVDEFFSTDN